MKGSEMWRNKLKNFNLIEVLDVVLLAIIIVVITFSWYQGDIDAEAKIREFNTITHTWSESKF